ncbi:MAG: hypothetical protein U1E65_28460 [Myxococcota bacterium]
MGFFDFIGRIGEGVSKLANTVTSFFTTKVQPFFSNISGLLGQVQGFGKSLEGAWGTIKGLIQRPSDLLNPQKLLAALNPQALLGEFSNLRKAVETLLSGLGVGKASDLAPEQQENLVRATQASAWQMALERYAA